MAALSEELMTFKMSVLKNKEESVPWDTKKISQNSAQ